MNWVVEINIKHKGNNNKCREHDSFHYFILGVRLGYNYRKYQVEIETCFPSYVINSNHCMNNDLKIVDKCDT